VLRRAAPCGSVLRRAVPRRAEPRSAGPPRLGDVPRVPAVLTIAGSDSGGGAGIQADLKAFAACGVHGLTALTALTAQNTVGVIAIHTLPPAFIGEQVRAVRDDIGVDAVKIGMLGTAATVAAVSQALDLLEPGTPVVVDPVMVSESGAVLLDDSARQALVELLLPRATVVTPNVGEARVLAGDGDPEVLAVKLHALGPANVVVTGGHRDAVTDLFFDGTDLHAIAGPRHQDGAAHGSGCTHSSALAAHLAYGFTPLEAAREARRIAGDAIAHGLRDIGRGAGPVDVLDVASRAPRVAARTLS
jgi:hydroxymethylpyrimidine/phosphomethylpyrimidine kinase